MDKQELYDYSQQEIITLQTTDGEDVEFLNIAGILLEENYYLILQPVERPEGMQEDETLVFSVTLNNAGEETYNIVLDNEIIDAVFSEYYRLLDEYEKDLDNDEETQDLDPTVELN